MSDNTQLDAPTSVALSFRMEDTEDQDISPFLLADDKDQPVQLSKLTESERERLDICKRKIQECLDEGFYALGCSLFEIKQDKLYRETHPTFAAFCQAEFKISRIHGDRLVNACRVQEILKSEPTGSVSIPKTESGMRALNGSSSEEVVAVGKQLKQDGCANPTATEVKKAKSKAVPTKKSTPATPKKHAANPLKPILDDVYDAISLVEAGKPKEQVIAELTKVAETIKSLLNPKGSV